MKFPDKLVNQFGAKAGLLMYVAKELLEIPQCVMIVKTPDESIDDVLKRADEAKISYPRILRSSAVAELDGYEGVFPTRIVEGPDSWFFKRNYPGMNFQERMLRTREEEKRYIEAIQKSPQQLKFIESGFHDNLPDNISVIIAKQSPSSIVGTYVKHPNVEDTTIMSITTIKSIKREDRIHYHLAYSSKEGVNILRGFDVDDYKKSQDITDSVARDIDNQIRTVTSWHDQIANLPLMDSNWTYQIEFGLDPVCLYQVRPFKKIERADFEIAQKAFHHPLIFGITSKEGIDVCCEKKIGKRLQNREQINPENNPVLFSDQLRHAGYQQYLSNVKVNVLELSIGMLAHNDIRAIRKADISALYPTGSPFNLEQSKWYNVKSDGKAIEIKPV